MALQNTVAPPEGSGPDESGADVTRFKKMLDDHRQATMDARQESLRDRDYFDGYQITDAQKKILEARRQPTNITNRTRRAVEGIIGVIEQGKTDPRAYMRNPPDDQPQPQQQMPGAPPQMQQGMQAQMMGGAAQQPQPQKPKMDAGDVFTKSLRYSADVIDFKSIKRQFVSNFLIEGTGAAIGEVDQANGNEVMGTAIRWEEFFYDPRSRRNDFLDARYMGIYKWQYADYVAALYPEKAEEIENFCDHGSVAIGGKFDFSWEDRPEDQDPWVDTKQKRLVVVEMYYIEGGQWLRCVFHAGGILSTPEPSPYKDDRSRPRNPIVAHSCYVDRNNKRYGIVRDMRGPQDEINMRHWKSTHEINTRQIQLVDMNFAGVTIDADDARKEAARPDGVLPPGWQIVPRQDVIANNVQMMMYATAEIERLGPSPAMLGRQSADSSGRSQQVRQQAGLTELWPVIAHIESWECRYYKGIGAIQRQFWTDPKWIRVTDDTGTPEYIRVNEPVPDPMTGQVVMVKNEIAKMDVDIVVETVPDTATIEQEIYNGLLQLAQAYGKDEVPFAVMLKLSPVPMHRKVLDDIAKLREEAAQAMLQNPMAQIEMAEKKAAIAKTMSEVHVNQTKAQGNQIDSTVTAMHATAEGRAMTKDKPPPGSNGALNGSGAPQSSQGSPTG